MREIDLGRATQMLEDRMRSSNRSCREVGITPRYTEAEIESAGKVLNEIMYGLDLALVGRDHFEVLRDFQSALGSLVAMEFTDGEDGIDERERSGIHE